jgi:hypothetical protein
MSDGTRVAMNQQMAIDCMEVRILNVVVTGRLGQELGPGIFKHAGPSSAK